MPDFGSGMRIAERYLVEERIGGGGMGVVYSGRDERLGRPVAIKFLAAEAVGDAVARARLYQEARAAAEIEHPAIVHVYDVGTTVEGGAFVVMELVRGRSLRAVLGAGGLTRSEAAHVVVETAAALGQAHRAGFVHRDVKPDNIMIRTDGRVAILDFGLVKAMDGGAGAPLTTVGGFVGTPAYMAPEQAEGGAIDGRTDQFSLAVTAYELLSQRLPWVGTTAMAILAEILQPCPSPIRRAFPEEGAEIDAVLARGLQRNPADRFPAIEDFAGALARAIDGRLSGVATPQVVVAWRSSPDLLLPAPTRPPEGAPRGEPAPPTLPVVEQGSRPDRRAGEVRGWGRVGVALLGGAVVVGGLLLRSTQEAPPPAGHPRRLTTAPGWEAEPALSPDGHLVAYVSDEKGNPDVWMVDARGGSSLRLTDDDAEDRAPAWFPDGSALAFASNRGGTWGIWKVPRLGGSATPLVENALDPAIAPDGQHIAFVRESAGGRSLVWVAPLQDVGRARAITTEQDGFWTNRRPAWSPDGTQIAYEDYSNLWVVPSAGGQARRLTSAGGGDGWASWSKDGRLLYFSGQHENTRALWRIPVKGGPMVRLTMGMGPESQPSVARSGVGLAYSTYEQQSSIIVVDLTSGARGTLPTDDVVTDIGISPDGREIAYVSDREGSRGLWVQAIAELTPRGPPRRLTQLPGALARPTYSPDGRWIAVHRAIDGQRDIWVLAAAGGLPHPITTDPAVDIQPAWSPDGAHLAFVSDRSGHRQVWVVPVADGHPAGPPREITHDALPKDLPAWSPDGAEISYRAGEGRESEIWTAPISGASARRITTGAVAYAARWEGRTGALLVAGTWGARFPTLRRVRLADGQSTPMNPEITFGNVDDAIFEVALDGRTAVIDFEISRGDVWMLDAPKGEAY